MNTEEAINVLTSYYNIEKEVLIRFLDNNKSDNTKNFDHIILPFTGIIYEDRCKGIVFNHGLYTQCCEKVKNKYCKVCEKQKYGDIYDRKNYEIGKYISKTGKPEIMYSKFIKKMNYDIEDVKKCFMLNGLDINIFIQEKPTKNRGRPRKESVSVVDNDYIEVVKVEIDGESYYKSKEGVILSIDSYDIVGIYKDNKISEINF